MTTSELVAESNRIEDILRPPTPTEISEFEAFITLGEITVDDLEFFVNIHQPGATLRDKPGMDVYVGNHHPPKGGPGVRGELEVLLDLCGSLDRNTSTTSKNAFRIHVEYETIHPFMDCNGRSGRMLWYWMMRNIPTAQGFGFLRMWYYQSLEFSRQ